jgi:hypothetical protein
VEGNVVTRSRASVLAAAVAVAGCYDLERLDPGPESHYLLIDDFEDGDGEPSASHFGTWRAYPFNPDFDVADPPEVVDGNDSYFALRGEFHFTGNQAYNGMSLGPGTTDTPIEARVFESIHLSARFVPEDGPFPQLTDYYVQLGCTDVRFTNPGPYFIHQNIELTNDWQTLVLPLDSFGEPTDLPPRIKGGPPACLAMVDFVRITVATKPSSGEPPITGSLYIDDVFFE